MDDERKFNWLTFTSEILIDLIEAAFKGKKEQ